MKITLFFGIVTSLLFTTSCTTNNNQNYLALLKKSGFHEKFTKESEAYMNKTIEALNNALHLMNQTYSKRKITRIKEQLLTYINSELDISKKFRERAENKMIQEGFLNTDKFLVFEKYFLIHNFYNKLSSKLPKESIYYLNKFVSEYVKSVIYSQDDPNDYMQFYQYHITEIKSQIYCAIIIIIEKYYN